MSKVIRGFSQYKIVLYQLKLLLFIFCFTSYHPWLNSHCNIHFLMQRYPTDRAYFIAKEILMTERTYKKDLEIINLVSNLRTYRYGFNVISLDSILFHILHYLPHFYLILIMYSCSLLLFFYFSRHGIYLVCRAYK